MLVFAVDVIHAVDFRHPAIVRRPSSLSITGEFEVSAFGGFNNFVECSFTTTTGRYRMATFAMSIGNQGGPFGIIRLFGKPRGNERRSISMTAKRTLFCVGLTAMITMSFFGCTPAGPPPSQIPPDNASSSTSKQASERSALSYGMITSRVKKDVTTQSELVELFGGPNIATTDSEGLETWVYERTSSESETVRDETRKASTQSEISRFGVFFGLGVAGKDSGKAETQSKVKGRTKTRHSIKSITVIVKFNANKTVKNYSVRSSSF